MKSTPILKQAFFVIAFLGYFITGVRAQQVDLDLFGGFSNYQGDLQEQVYTWEQGHWAYGFGLTYRNGYFGIRGIASFGRVSADDKLNKPELRVRNLNFTSEIYDASLLLLVDLMNIREKRFTPYVLGGISAFHFNPYTFDPKGDKVFLRSLSTEGQGLPEYPDRKVYKNNQFAIPLGGGIRVQLGDYFTLAWEFKFHKSFTDYIDDVSKNYVDYDILLNARGPQAVEYAFRADEVNPSATYPNAGSQRGYPKENDWYYFSGLLLNVKIIDLDYDVRRRKREAAQMRCPAQF